MKKKVRRIDYHIGDGNSGIYDTVSYMWNYALRDASEPAVKALVKQLQGANRAETLQNIFHYVISNVSYKLDPKEYEMVTAPIHYVNGNRSTGDCDCMTTLLVCLLEAAGFESAITVIAWRSTDFTHVFAEVRLYGKWYVLDATLGWNGYLKQDKKILKQHRTEKKDMAKLVVLADGGGASTGSYDVSTSNYDDLPPTMRIGKRNRNSSCNRNKNDNGNNINIHFGNIGTQDVPIYAPSVSSAEKPPQAYSGTSSFKASTNQPIRLPSKRPPGGWSSIENTTPSGSVNTDNSNKNNTVTTKPKQRAKFYPEFP